MALKPWKRVEPTKVDVIGWRAIVTKTFRMPDRTMAEFNTFGTEHVHYVAVVAATPDHKVIVARQFRSGPEKIMDELPGGGVEDGEELIAAAERELLEETGYKAKTMKYLGAVYKDEHMNAVWHYYFATGCRRVADQELEGDEHIEHDTITIETFMKNARTGKMTDIGGVFLAYEDLQNLI